MGASRRASRGHARPSRHAGGPAPGAQAFGMGPRRGRQDGGRRPASPQVVAHPRPDRPGARRGATLAGGGAAEAGPTPLPHPVIVIAPDGKIADANVAAESFFEASLPLLRRYALRDVVPFGSPLLALVEQVRRGGAAVNEYKVDLSTPRIPGERLVDLHVAPMPEQPGYIVVMLQERTIADKMDRQLTPRGAARSAIARAARRAHEG